jgi:hypothetical protein
MKKLSRNEMKNVVGGKLAGGGSTCVDCGGSTGLVCGSSSCSEVHVGTFHGLACPNSNNTVQNFWQCPASNTP